MLFYRGTSLKILITRHWSVLGWGTLIAGFFFNLHQPVWVGTPKITEPLIASMLTVIFLGTIIPFGLLLYATHYAPSDVISIMDAVQPITTSILSIIFFKMGMNWIEVVGIVLELLVFISYNADGKILKTRREFSSRCIK